MNRIIFRSQWLSSPLITCNENHRPGRTPTWRIGDWKFQKKLPPLYLGEAWGGDRLKTMIFLSNGYKLYQSLSDSPGSVLSALSWYQSTVQKNRNYEKRLFIVPPFYPNIPIILKYDDYKVKNVFLERTWCTPTIIQSDYDEEPPVSQQAGEAINGFFICKKEITDYVTETCTTAGEIHYNSSPQSRAQQEQGTSPWRCPSSSNWTSSSSSPA